MINSLRTIARNFRADTRANVAITFALFSIPTTLITGVAIDYSLMNRAAVHLQSAADSAVLAGARQDSDRQSIARSMFHAATGTSTTDTSVSIAFSESGSTLAATATMTVKTAVMKIAGIDQVTITRTARASSGSAATPDFNDNSCILALGSASDTSKDTLDLQPGSDLTLSGCALRATASINCDGMETGATSIAAGGAATGCRNALTGQSALPDIYEELTSKIEPLCGNTKGGAEINASAVSTDSPNIISATRSGYREIHVCGTLTLSGAGALNSDPDGDLVIVIENGGLTLSPGANIQASRTTFVLAGGTGNNVIKFPASDAATLALSPSLANSNPWAGISAYLNPTINSNTIMNWGSGANLSLDGIAYLAGASIRSGGSLTQGATGCSKLVVGDIRIEGKATLQQAKQACETLAVNQYGLPGQPAASAYLTE